jgi:hypothetical protein
MYDIRYHMRADIVFLKDQQHDPSSCRYVQLVQLTTSANGVPGTKTETGVPADGQLHLDVAWPVPPGWTDDNIEKHLNLLPSTSSTSLSLPDSPGIRNQPTGTTITYDAIFEAIVKDITRRDSEGDLLTVAFDWLHINATGTVPRPSVFPGTLSQGY